MAKKPEQFETRVTRQSLRKLAADLLEQFFKEKKSILVNYYGILGMGKDHLLRQALIPLLDSNEIQHDEIIDIHASPPATEVLAVSQKIAEWVHRNVLKSKEKIASDMNGLERVYFNLRGQLSERKDKQSFAVLVNDISNLPFDDLDWLQSVVLEALVSSPGSIVVVTSQNELNWHTWEMRNKCVPVELPLFSPNEILALCESKPLAEKIEELSAGHPQTVQALVNTAREKMPLLSSVTEKDAAFLEEKFINILKDEIDKNLNFKSKNDWLRKMFYLAAVPDGFDAELVYDMSEQFNKGKEEKKKIFVPEEITDIAWEMAYTGLVTWDFKEKTYKMNQGLRSRILAYKYYREKEDYLESLKSIIKSYEVRARKSAYSKALLTLVKKYSQKLNMMKSQPPQKQYLRKAEKVAPFKAKVESVSDKLQGVKMENVPYSMRKTPWIYINRVEQEFLFKKFINGEINEKWILSISGKAGLGKSRLIEEFSIIARNQGFPIVFIDLHERKNRYREIFLWQVIEQLKIKDAEIKNSIKILVNPGKGEYTGSTGKEFFEDVLQRITLQLVDYLIQNYAGRRIVLFVDTMDVKEDPSIEYFEEWISTEFLPLLQNMTYVVVAGRSPVLKNKKLNEGVEKLTLTKLDKKFIHEFVINRIPKLGIQPELASEVELLAEGNPLFADWVMFYLRENDPEGRQLKEFVGQGDVLDFIAQKMWHEQNGVMLAFQAAVHFGPHFSFDLFKSVIQLSQLGGKTHKEVFDQFAKSFYIRTSRTKWTLHDDVRERMLLNMPKAKRPLKVLEKLSDFALQRYYARKLAGYKKKSLLSLPARSELEDIEAQFYYHSLFSGKKEYRKLWNYLDDLWHRYRLDQMYQVIQFGREAQKWNAKLSVTEDKLLEDLLNAAYAWMLHSSDKFEKAVEFAKKVTKSPHRRLRATANIVLGFIEQNPKKAIRYLNIAKKLYEQLKHDLEKNRLKKNEFYDQLIDVYQELHLCLLKIGEIRWQHFFNLEEGEVVLEEALKLTKEDAWVSKSPYVPLYEATALNSLARIYRFRGMFGEASRMVLRAISIFEKQNLLDINLGRFYETLGLIKKADGKHDLAAKHFDKALEIYNNIRIGSMEKYKATLNLEIGHLLYSDRKYAEAEKRFVDSLASLKKYRRSMLYYYLSALNKLGELYIRRYEESANKDLLISAKEYLIEQKNLAIKDEYELWEYWGTHNLQKIDYLQNGLAHKQRIQKTLNALLQRYKNNEFQPAFWDTQYLLHQIAKENGDVRSSLIHLAKGLAGLAGVWSLKFKNNLDILSNEILALPEKDRSTEAQNLIRFWKQNFKRKDPEPEFIQLCESFVN